MTVAKERTGGRRRHRGGEPLDGLGADRRRDRWSFPFDVDDYVEKGEVIVRFRDREQQARLEPGPGHAGRGPRAARPGAGRVRSHQTVYEQGVVSKSRMDQARAEFESAQARVEASRAALEEAREQFGHTVVEAPYSGIVMDAACRVAKRRPWAKPLMTGPFARAPAARLPTFRNATSGPCASAARRACVLPDGSSVDAAGLRIFPYAEAGTHTRSAYAWTCPSSQHGVYPGMLVKVALRRRPAGTTARARRRSRCAAARSRPCRT
ncbi:MAG: hypothetical protein U5K33_03285 [Halofilum sp. (in: g-proteobacteria)]|nr:hypothetical protein [Halofilum sp. (in: g-proteobacteria)]